jgi:hypothetical protein
MAFELERIHRVEEVEHFVDTVAPWHRYVCTLPSSTTLLTVWILKLGLVKVSWCKYGLLNTAFQLITLLRSSVIEDLHHEQSQNPNAAPIAYFYCSRDSAEPERASPEEIMRCIVEQVASNTADLPVREPLVAVYKQKKRESHGRPLGDRLTLNETTDILLQIFEENPATIVIDGLDECDPTERHMLLSTLDDIITESASLVRVFVSSRNDGDIVCQLQKSPNIFIRASDNSADITKYVQDRVSEAINKRRMARGSISPEMKERIISTLINGAQGM